MEYVHFERTPPVLFRVHAGTGGDVRDEDVAATKGLGSGFEPGLVGVGIAHVHAATHHVHITLLQSDGGLGHFVLVAGTEADVGAFRRQQFDDGSTNALGGTGNDGLLSAQSEIHGELPAALVGPAKTGECPV